MRLPSESLSPEPRTPREGGTHKHDFPRPASRSTWLSREISEGPEQAQLDSLSAPRTPLGGSSRCGGGGGLPPRCREETQRSAALPPGRRGEPEAVGPARPAFTSLAPSPGPGLSLGLSFRSFSSARCSAPVRTTHTHSSLPPQLGPGRAVSQAPPKPAADPKATSGLEEAALSVR